jgi:hypothetical protein
MSRDFIWLNQNYSEHMDITKVIFVTSEIEAEEEIVDEDEQYAEQEGTFDLPSTTEEDHTELLVDTPTTTKPGIKKSKLWHHWTST